MIYTISIWLLPAIIAITFHEAAHAFVARALGDDTASRLGRVSLNPLKHIDPFGTILVPGILLLTHSPFLFGYAKPVPVNFGALHNPRRDMVLVAAAGPAMNIALAVLAALGFHLLGSLPVNIVQWVAENLKNAIILNVVLAVFVCFPFRRSMVDVLRWGCFPISSRFRCRGWSLTAWQFLSVLSSFCPCWARKQDLISVLCHA